MICSKSKAKLIVLQNDDCIFADTTTTIKELGLFDLNISLNADKLASDEINFARFYPITTDNKFIVWAERYYDKSNVVIAYIDLSNKEVAYADGVDDTEHLDMDEVRFAIDNYIATLQAYQALKQNKNTIFATIKTGKATLCLPLTTPMSKDTLFLNSPFVAGATLPTGGKLRLIWEWGVPILLGDTFNLNPKVIMEQQ